MNELALGYPEGRIELQLIGGFRDQQGYAEDLFSNIMRKFVAFMKKFVVVLNCNDKTINFTIPS